MLAEARAVIRQRYGNAAAALLTEGNPGSIVGIAS